MFFIEEIQESNKNLKFCIGYFRKQKNKYEFFLSYLAKNIFYFLNEKNINELNKLMNIKISYITKDLQQLVDFMSKAPTNYGLFLSEKFLKDCQFYVYKIVDLNLSCLKLYIIKVQKQDREVFSCLLCNNYSLINSKNYNSLFINNSYFLFQNQFVIENIEETNTIKEIFGFKKNLKIIITKHYLKMSFEDFNQFVKSLFN
jgi:hypothetical protein